MSVPPRNPEHNPATLSRTQTKGSAQSSFPHLECHPLGNHRQLLCNHSGGLACSLLLPGFRVLTWSPFWGLEPPLSMWLQSQKVPQIHWPGCVPGRQGHLPYFPWVYNSFPDGLDQMLFLAQTSPFSRRFWPPISPFFSPG